GRGHADGSDPPRLISPLQIRYAPRTDWPFSTSLKAAIPCALIRRNREARPRPCKPMRIGHGYRQVPAEIQGAALAIGNFDGVHRGHQTLLLTALKHARATGKPAGVMVFEPHPREFFRPDEPHFTLTTLQEKVRLIERLGLDFV